MELVYFYFGLNSVLLFIFFVLVKIALVFENLTWINREQ